MFVVCTLSVYTLNFTRWWSQIGITAVIALKIVSQLVHFLKEEDAIALNPLELHTVQIAFINRVNFHGKFHTLVQGQFVLFLFFFSWYGAPDINLLLNSELQSPELLVKAEVKASIRLH